MSELTINCLVDLVTEINTANGWRENSGALLTGEIPEAQIASLSPVAVAQTDLIEAIRRSQAAVMSTGALDRMEKIADLIHRMGIENHAQSYIRVFGEEGHPVYGSKMQSICRLRLMDTETVEATEAVLSGDVDNLAEELADITIRVLDFVGAWNEAHLDKPINLQDAVMAKLEKNRTRGHHHGGKRA